jgi:trehalose-6-phosphate synthase
MSYDLFIPQALPLQPQLGAKEVVVMAVTVQMGLEIMALEARLPHVVSRSKGTDQAWREREQALIDYDRRQSAHGLALKQRAILPLLLCCPEWRAVTRLLNDHLSHLKGDNFAHTVKVEVV